MAIHTGCIYLGNGHVLDSWSAISDLRSSETPTKINFTCGHVLKMLAIPILLDTLSNSSITTTILDESAESTISEVTALKAETGSNSA